MYPIITIKRERLASVQRRHPWIFSRAVIQIPDLDDGEIVEIRDPKGNFLAIGHFQNSSILVRILSFENRKIDETFWNEKVAAAIELRKAIGLPDEKTNAYRLIHGEGDGLPGLIVDIYDGAAVIQCHSIGMHKQLKAIAQAIDFQLPQKPEVIYDKSSSSLPENYAAEMQNGFLKGDQDRWQILENGNIFRIDLINSQKTGFFLDQRNNRFLLSHFSKGKKLLNLYAYTGGFSVYALNSGALEVVSIDSSRKAIEMLEENIGFCKGADRHIAFVEDVNKYLKSIEKDRFDIIVLDPPAFAKSIRKRHAAVQAYKRINKLALESLPPGGILFTFSCSQVIDQKLFYDTVTAAAIESGREATVLYQLSQGADHPVSLFHHEAKYLKGLVLSIQK